MKLLFSCLFSWKSRKIFFNVSRFWSPDFLNLTVLFCFLNYSGFSYKIANHFIDYVRYFEHPNNWPALKSMDFLLKILIGIRIFGSKYQKNIFSKFPMVIMNYKIETTAVSWGGRGPCGERGNEERVIEW